MIFTHEEILEIHHRLALLGIKDTRIRILRAFERLTGKETFVIVRHGENVRIPIRRLAEFLTTSNTTNSVDILNVTNYVANTESNDNVSLTLETAVGNVPEEMRKKGLIITFSDSQGKWKIYQMTAKVDDAWDKRNFEEIGKETDLSNVDVSTFNNDVHYVTLDELNDILDEREKENQDELNSYSYDEQNTELIINSFIPESHDENI